MQYRYLSECNETFFFLNLKTTSNTDMAFSADASTTIGCGAVFRDEWFAHKWPKKMLYHPATEKSTAPFEIFLLL
jgi:hypothetical protein